MLKPCFWGALPVALFACSTSPPNLFSQNTGAAGGGFGSSSGIGGGSGTGSAATTGGWDYPSSGGSGGAVAIAGAESAAIGTPGASGSDSSTDSGLSGVGGSSNADACTAVFCEDFEQAQGQVDTAKWDLQMGAGGIEMVQEEIVAHGKYALHVHGTGARGDFAMILTKNAPMALQGAGPVFGRAYLYATSNLSAHIELGFAGTTRDPAVHPSITTNGMNLNYMEFAEIGGSWQLGFDLFNPAPSVANGFVEEASYPPAHDQAPAEKWSCVEWEFGDAPEAMVLWVDGKQLDQFDVQHIDFTSTTRAPGSVLNGKSSGIIGGFSVFGFGFHSWASSTAVDRYYDDIVLDTKRVNCLP
jgi:hypothetical protein